MPEYEKSDFSHSHMMQSKHSKAQEGQNSLEILGFVHRHFVLDSRSSLFAATFGCESKNSLITISQPQEIIEHLETEDL